MFDDVFDLVVIGAGMGGLATAALAQRQGLRVALLEAHTKLGGSAGYFERGPYTFDVGATALMGLRPNEPIGGLLRSIGAEFEGVQTSSYRVCLPDRELQITPDPTAFLTAVTQVFPGQSAAKQRFWNLQESVGNTLFTVASRVARLPIRSLSDVIYDGRILGFSGLAAASTWLVTVEDVLRILGLHHDRAFRCWVAMLLQDTAQAGPETVPFANAAACLQAYRLGMSRPRGGMKALAESIGGRFGALGGDLRTATKVDRVEQSTEGFAVTTRRRQVLRTRQVALNVPLDLAVDLLGRSLVGRLARRERQSRAQWSAFTGYVAFRRETTDDNGPLFHQVLQDYDQPIHDGNNVLVSLSPPGDPGYGPPDVRVATMSTHTRPAEWSGLDNDARRLKKQDYAQRLLKALDRAIPGASENLTHAEFATPRSFQRYTRRKAGAVGGPPVSRGNSTFLAVDSDVLGPGLWVVGDSVFPGQGTMAVVLSAIRVIERITNQSWAAIQHVRN